MALQAQQQLGRIQKTRILALENAYHGETLFTSSLSDCDLYKSPFKESILEQPKIPVPYCEYGDDLWHNCDDFWQEQIDYLESIKNSLAGVIVEPIIQGAAGLKIYSLDFLKRLYIWTKENQIYFIADEVMTGMGRVGKIRACEWAGILPDFSVFSKGLTAGFTPLSCVLTTDAVYEVFYAPYSEGKSFLHSHTYCGHSLAVAVALEVLNIYETENTFEYVQKYSPLLKEYFEDINLELNCFRNIRCFGFVIAADLCNKDGELFEEKMRVGFEVYKRGISYGIYLRPIANTIYWMPPLNTSIEVLEEMKEKTLFVIKEVFDELT